MKQPAKGSTRKHPGHRKAKHAGSAKKHSPAKAKHTPPPTRPVYGTFLPMGHGGAPVTVVVARMPVPPKPRQLALGQAVACCAAESLAASIRLTGGRVPEEAVLALYRVTAADPDQGQALSVALRAAQRHSLAGHFPSFFPVAPDDPRAVLLGAELPGSHAVCAGPDGAWWSWGEPHDPAEWPDAVIEEAWAVTWQ